MIDTPKARELGLPWTLRVLRVAGAGPDEPLLPVVLPVSEMGMLVAVASNGLRGPQDFLSAAAASTNLIGPHLDTPDRMSALRAVSAMDDMDFGMLADFLKERGFM